MLRLYDSLQVQTQKDLRKALVDVTIMSPKIAFRDKIATRHNSAAAIATKPYVDRLRRKWRVNKRILQSSAAQLAPRGE
jgi:hypothetical protein